MNSRNLLKIAGILGLALVFGFVRNFAFPGGVSFQSNSQPRHTEISDTLSLEITVQAAYRLYQDSVQFIDARTPEEFEKSHIPGAINIPANASFDEQSKLTSLLNPAKTYVVYCRNPECPLSHQLYEFLQFANFTNTYIMFEGIDEWKAAGFPVVAGDADDSE